MKSTLIILLIPMLQGCSSFQDYVNVTKRVPHFGHSTAEQRYEHAVVNGFKPHSHKFNRVAEDNARVWGNMHQVGASNFYIGNGGVESWQTKRMYDPAMRKFRPYLNEAEYLNK